MNTKPGYLLRATPEEFAAWEAGAAYENSTLAEWIRRTLNESIQRQQRSNCWLPELPRDWEPPQVPATRAAKTKRKRQ